MIEAEINMLSPVATELVKPVRGSLVFIPDIPEGSSIQDLGISVFEKGSGPVGYDPDTHTGIERRDNELCITDPYSGVRIKPIGGATEILVRTTNICEVFSPHNVGHLPVDLPTFEITYQVANEDGDPEAVHVAFGGSVPSLTLPGVGSFAVRS